MRIESGDHDGLLSALAAAADDEGFSVPVRALGEILGRAIAGKIHGQKIAGIAVVVADGPVILQRAVEL